MDTDSKTFTRSLEKEITIYQTAILQTIKRRKIILDLVGELKVRSVENYAIIKQTVFDAFEAMSEKEGDYTGMYAKGEVPEN